jgi:predicted transcriptional regulator
MIYGAPGVGKSYLALTLLYAIHTGTPWLGWEVDLFTEPRSIFIDGEMPTALLKTRIIDVFGNSDLPHEARIFSKQHYLDENPDGVFNIANEGSRNYILNKVIEHDINIVFIDNKASLVNGISENDVAENEPVNSWLIRLRSMNVMVVLLHHSNKTGAQRGTSAYEDPMDNILKLGKKSDGVKRQLVWEKDRRGRPDNCDYTINLELSEFGMQPVTFTPTDVVAKSYDKINIIIGDVDKFNKDSLQKRADRLGLSKKIVFNILDKAVEDGYIEKDKTGNIIYYTLTRSGKRYLKDFKFDDSILE